MQSDFAVIDELIGRIVNEIHSRFGKIIHYSPDVAVTPAEAHFVEAIHDHPQANTNELAEILGLTKGNISLRAARLCKKGYIEKFNREDNKKEIHYRLKAKGSELYNAHASYHFGRNRAIYNRFDALSPAEKELICSFLFEYAKYMGDFYVDEKGLLHREHLNGVKQDTK